MVRPSWDTDHHQVRHVEGVSPEAAGAATGNDAAMDDARFDRLARLLGAAGTRRGALAALLGSILGGAGLGSVAAAGAARDRRDGADAAGRRRRRKKCDPPCGANFACLNGRCHCPTVGCGAACCPAGQVCQNGACAEVVSCHAYGQACGDSIPCCDGLQCGSGFGGGPVGCWLVPGSACAADEECGYGQHCRQGVCVVDPPPCNGGCIAPLVCRYDACVYVTPSQVAAFGSFGDVASTNGGLGQSDGFLNFPTSLALDAGGDMAWIADRYNNRIVAWTRSGGGWRHVASLGNGGDGTAGDGTGQMRLPFGVAVNPEGTVAWITDTGDYVANPATTPPNNRVVIWTKRGGAWSQTGEFGSYGIATGASQTDGKLNDPFGIWVDPAGTTAFIADRANDRIVIWKSLGGTWTHTASFGTSGSTDLGQTDGKLGRPRDVVVDGAGTTAYVSDNLNSRIAVWTQTGGAWRHVASFGRAGEATGPADGVVRQPFELALNADGSVMWIANRGSSRVTVWTRQGGAWTQVSSFGRFGATNLGQTDGQMDEPRGVAYADGGAAVWVADTDNSRITVWE